MIDLSEVDPEVPAHAVSQRDHVLGERRTEIAFDTPVGRGRGFDRVRKTAFHPELREPRWRIEAERGAEKLAVLGQHAMAVEIPICREVGDDLERILGVLQGSRRSLAPVGAIRKQSFEHRAGVCMQLLPPSIGVREKCRRDHLAFCLRVVFEQANHRRGLAGAGPRRQPRRRLTHMCKPFRGREAVALVERALHEGGDDQRELSMHVGRERAALGQFMGGELGDEVFERTPVSEEAEVGQSARGQQAAQHVEGLRARGGLPRAVGLPLLEGEPLANRQRKRLDEGAVRLEELIGSRLIIGMAQLRATVVEKSSVTAGAVEPDIAR